MKKRILSLCLVLVLLATAVIGGTLAYFTDTDEVQNEFTMGKVKIDLWETGANNEKVQDGIKFDAPIVPGHNFDKDPSITVEANSEESYVFLDMSFNKYSSLFWVMAADAAADATIDMPLYDNGALAETFKNDNGVFSTTKFLQYMVQNPTTMQAIVAKWFTDINHTDWETCDIIANDTYITLRFLYIGQDATKKTVAKATTDTELGAFFTAFHMPASVTQEMIESGAGNADGNVEIPNIGHMQNNFNTEKEKFHMNFKAYAIQADTFENMGAAYKALFNIELNSTMKP